MIVHGDRRPFRTVWVLVFGLALGLALHWWLPDPAGTVVYDRCDQEVCP